MTRADIAETNNARHSEFSVGEKIARIRIDRRSSDEKSASHLDDRESIENPDCNGSDHTENNLILPHDRAGYFLSRLRKFLVDIHIVSAVEDAQVSSKLEKFADCRKRVDNFFRKISL